jgi:hypothetical protein
MGEVGGGEGVGIFTKTLQKRWGQWIGADAGTEVKTGAKGQGRRRQGCLMTAGQHCLTRQCSAPRARHEPGVRTCVRACRVNQFCDHEAPGFRDVVIRNVRSKQLIEQLERASGN